MEKKRLDIKLVTLLKYYALFIIPVMLSFLISWKIAPFIGPHFQLPNTVVSQVLMIFFTFLIFSMLVPYIRHRENVAGVRFALVGFFLFGMFMTIPSLLKGYSGMILMQFLYIANYILITFIYCPEVLGIDVDLRVWFSKSRQLLVIFIYLSIVLFYVMGFGWLYFELAADTTYGTAFNTNNYEVIDYGTFLYFSIITFTTIGYGDITPMSVGARMVVGLEAIMGMIINVVFIAILFMYISNVQSVIRREDSLEKKEISLERAEKRLESEVEQLAGKNIGSIEDSINSEKLPDYSIEKRIP